MTMTDHECDVMVIGGGMAGTAAAIAAARGGARTVLIESASALGGMGTCGLVPALAPYNYNDPHGPPWIRGLAWEFVERLDRADALLGLGPNQWWKLFDKEKAKLVLDRMALEAGVRVRFFTTFFEAQVRSRRVESILTASKAGPERWKAKIVIDATGDADLCAAAGAAVEVAETPMPPTYCFTVGNIDRARLGDPKRVNEALVRGKREGRLRNPEDHRGEKDIFGPDVMVFNYNHVYDVDCLDPDDLTRATIEGRETAYELLDYLKDTVPGFERARIVNLASLLGVRETRRIVGDFRLTGRAYFESHRHEDDVCVYDYAIDLHASRPTAEEREEYYELYYNRRTRPGEVYGIPFRSLRPADLDNVLAAGRCISCDRQMLASLRVMPTCLATGEAAGAAAAIATTENEALRDVSSARLQDALRSNGAYIP